MNKIDQMRVAVAHKRLELVALKNDIERMERDIRLAVIDTHSDPEIRQVAVSAAPPVPNL